MFTNFYNIWHTVYSVNLKHKLLIYLPHLRIAATLPWETLIVELSLVQKV